MRFMHRCDAGLMDGFRAVYQSNKTVIVSFSCVCCLRAARTHHTTYNASSTQRYANRSHRHRNVNRSQKRSAATLPIRATSTAIVAIAAATANAAQAAAAAAMAIRRRITGRRTCSRRCSLHQMNHFAVDICAAKNEPTTISWFPRVEIEIVLTVVVQRFLIVQHTTAVDKALQIGCDSSLSDDMLLELAHGNLKTELTHSERINNT